MFSSRKRTVTTGAGVLELGIAGWYLGHGATWLWAVVAVVTLADCGFGVVRRGVPADVTGIGLAVILVLLAVYPTDGPLTIAVALACAAWLIRPARQASLVRGGPLRPPPKGG